MSGGVSNRTYLRLYSLVLRDVLDVPLVFNKVGRPGPKFEIVYPSAFELEPKVCIDCDERRVQPPRKHLSKGVPTGWLHVRFIFQSVVPALREIATRVGTSRALQGKRTIGNGGQAIRDV